jgi:hypothetical protein
MDIVRDESVKRNKRRKQVIISVIAVIAVLGITLGVSRLKPAAPSVEYGTICKTWVNDETGEGFRDADTDS